MRLIQILFIFTLTHSLFTVFIVVVVVSIVVVMDLCRYSYIDCFLYITLFYCVCCNW